MYIVLEGIVGSGKTTQVKRLGEYFRSVIARNEAIQCSQELGLPRRFSLEQKNSSQWREYEPPKVIHVREPGTTPIAEDIRHLAQGKEWKNETMHPLTNAYLFAAARAQTLETLVKPALENGDIVISDRSFLSSCAIQGEAQGLGIEKILEMNLPIVQDILPDIVLYLDIDIDLALSRTSDHWRDKFEREWKWFYQSIIRWYEKCEKLEIMRNRFFRIDTNGNEDEVFERVLLCMNTLIQS